MGDYTNIDRNSAFISALKAKSKGLEKAVNNYQKFSQKQIPGVVASALNYSLDSLKNKKILDLGCGSNIENCYQPNLCRILLEKGAKPIGIDLEIDPSKEKFECYKTSVMQGLSMFKKNYFDAVVTSLLFDSKAFLRSIGENWSSPKYENQIRNHIEKISPILKNNGIYLNFQLANMDAPLMEMCAKEKLIPILLSISTHAPLLVFKKRK